MTRVFVAAAVIVALTSSGRPRILAAAGQSCESRMGRNDPLRGDG